MDAGNYTFSASGAGTADITARALTVSGITAADKTYDGNTTATVVTGNAVYGGLISGDALGLTATGTFDSKDVGTGKTVTLVSSYTGADAGNYAVVDQKFTTASISDAQAILLPNLPQPLTQSAPMPPASLLDLAVGADVLGSAASDSGAGIGSGAAGTGTGAVGATDAGAGLDAGLSLEVDGDAAVLRRTGGDAGTQGTAGAVQTSLVAVYRLKGQDLAPVEMLTIVEQGQTVKASPSTQVLTSTPRLERDAMRFTSISRASTSGERLEITVGISGDGVLLIQVPRVLGAEMNERHLVLLGLEAVREQFGVNSGSISAVILEIQS